MKETDHCSSMWMIFSNFTFIHLTITASEHCFSSKEEPRIIARTTSFFQGIQTFSLNYFFACKTLVGIFYVSMLSAHGREIGNNCYFCGILTVHFNIALNNISVIASFSVLVLLSVKYKSPLQSHIISYKYNSVNWEMYDIGCRLRGT